MRRYTIITRRNVWKEANKAMNQKKISRKISKNTILGIVFKLLTMLLSLASRTVFIRFMSDECLGINGLYSNLLSVLSMADFGINAVMIYILYEPLVNEDAKRLAALVKLFKRVYYSIAGLIYFLGIALIPILPVIVSENSLPLTDLIKYYLIFLTNSALSYLGSYKSTLLIADQKGYYVNAISFYSNTTSVIIQIFVLYITHDFTTYLLVMIVGTAVNNVVLSFTANRIYPVLKNKNVSADVSDIKPILIERTKSVFLYRVGGTIIDSTDNILISIITGTVMVGYYSNYSLIATNVFALLGVLSQACMTGIGNFGVKASTENKKNAFFLMLLLYFFAGTLALCGMLSVMNDFMRIWLKQEQYILTQSFVIVLATRLFLDFVLSPNWVFREALGLFNEAKKIRLLAAGINVILSVLMGKHWGLSGIVAATTISKLLTTFWYEPRIISIKVFGESSLGYWKIWIKMAIVTAVAAVLSLYTTEWFEQWVQQPALQIFTKGMICIVIVVCLFVLFIYREKQYRELLISRKYLFARKR